MMSVQRTVPGRRAPVLGLTLACVAGAALGVSQASAQLVNVSPSKANGTYIAGSGIPGDLFLQNSGGGVSVFLKARDRNTGSSFPTSGMPLKVAGSTFLNVTDLGLSPQRWSFDFQFTPREDDVVDGRNYTLILETDSDPSAARAFEAISQPLYDLAGDNDIDDTLALPGDGDWEDSDGFFVNPGPGAWSDDDIDFVYSQSWRPGFDFSPAPVNPDFFDGDELVPGDYDIRWSVLSPAGNQLAEIQATARLVPVDMTAVTLDAADSCLDASEDQLVVEVNLSNAQAEISGGQFFLDYDESVLSFVSMEPGDIAGSDPDNPFEVQVYEVVDTVNGTIDYGVGQIFDPMLATDNNVTMARITFDVLDGFNDAAALVAFRSNLPPTRLTELGGAEVVPYLADLGNVTNDLQAPTLNVPSDITVAADAGSCEAIVDPGVATATDNYDDTPSVVGERDDMLPLDAPYPAGTTVITWTATDDCGNSSSFAQTITVSNSNLLDVVVELADVNLGEGIAIDGDLSDWPSAASNGITSNGGDQIEIFSAWGPDGLYIGFGSDDMTDGRVSDEDDQFSINLGLAGNTSSSAFSQGFESNTVGWFDAASDWNGTVTRVASGTNGIASSSGGFHSIMEDPDDFTGPFSRFGGYSFEWPGGIVAKVDIYLDPSWAPGEGFDHSMAMNRSDGGFLRDFIFHVTKDTSTGALLVGASNNTNFDPREDLENINSYEVTAAGWYTFERVFRDAGDGSLAVDMNLRDSSGALLFTEVRNTAADDLATVVGGNRYMWFTNIDIAGGIAVDNQSLALNSGSDWRYAWDFISDSAQNAGPVGDTVMSGTPGDYWGDWRVGDDSMESNATFGVPANVVDNAPATTGIVQKTSFLSGSRVTEIFIPNAELFDGQNGWTLGNRDLVRFMGSYTPDTGGAGFVYPAGGDFGDQSTYLSVAADLVSEGATLDRCITFELEDDMGVATEIEATVSFINGVGVAQIEIPCGMYTCISARDTLHTLRARDDDQFAIVGTNYIADFTDNGDDDRLIGGNFNDDEFIDILDFGVFVGQFGATIGDDTVCGTSAPHADASGDGTVGAEDFTFVSANFLEVSEIACDSTARLAGAQPVTSITIEELHARGMEHLAHADLNRDGVIDQHDIGAFFGGARPDFMADLNADGVIDWADIYALHDALMIGDTETGDVNADGRFDHADLFFVIDRLGTVVVR